MKKPKVLMVTSSYPIKGSNLGPFVKNIVDGLVSKNVDVGVMIFSTTKRFKRYNKDGATIYEYPYTKILPPLLHKNRGLIPSVKSSFFAKLELLGYFFSTKRFLKGISKEYDIVHAHWYVPSGFIACLSSIRKPIITTAWGAEFHLPNNLLVRKMLGFVDKKSQMTVAVSEYMKKRATKYKLDISKMLVVPNGVHYSTFALKRVKQDKIIIATARRLVPEKRIDDLIRAVAKMSRKDNIEL
jgi:glycosyltransferase involved in cell wall biosynthesis